MPSETDIVNRALRRVSGTRITSLTDGSANANIASDVYEQVFHDMLRGHAWKFATKLTKLARLSAVPTYEFDFAYALPADWLRTVAVHDNDAGSSVVIYREAEIADVGTLLASAEDIWLRYVYKVTDINRAPEDFHTALAMALAEEFAIPVANSNTIYDKAVIAASKALRKAKSADSMGTPADPRTAGSWATSRGSWPSTRWPR